MQRDPRTRLYDAIKACERITSFVAGKLVEDVASDVMLSSALERQFEVLGEALNAFDRLHPEASAGIEEVSVAVAMRNLISHEYFIVDPRTLVQTANDDIPALKSKLEAVLNDLS